MVWHSLRLSVRCNQLARRKGIHCTFELHNNDISRQRNSCQCEIFLYPWWTPRGFNVFFISWRRNITEWQSHVIEICQNNKLHIIYPYNVNRAQKVLNCIFTPLKLHACKVSAILVYKNDKAPGAIACAGDMTAILFVDHRILMAWPHSYTDMWWRFLHSCAVHNLQFSEKSVTKAKKFMSHQRGLAYGAWGDASGRD